MNYEDDKVMKIITVKPYANVNKLKTGTIPI